MAMSGGKDDGEPMMEMNTTPLIDVMLVLLIMFIITIPVATHAVSIDLPNPNTPPPDTVIKRDKNKVVIMPNNDIQWNGTSMNLGQLRGALNATMAMKPEPELQFQPDGQAPYETTAIVLNVIKGSGVTAFGFVGNEQYASFGKDPKAPPAK
ncbi:MAG: biopolymer transporter ExbD [Novosphingobium sp.]|nr:biopolymer transporter ExbD [Novosphingobium sp.]MBX9644617.1 biopolymer transporter ExbD [Novosphingobium sp.]